VEKTILVTVRLTLNKLVVIKHLVGINGATLIVYRVDDYFQYEIAFWDGSIYQPQEVYETAIQARNVGVASIKTTIGY
jgi:hypothetical protein